MELTQAPITLDWQGEPIQWGFTYLLVDCDTAILYSANDPYDVEEFLKSEYPDEFKNYKHDSFDGLMELLSDCTTSPEYHVANSNNELTAGNSNDENTEISEATFIQYNDEDEENEKEIEDELVHPTSFFNSVFKED